MRNEAFFLFFFSSSFLFVHFVLFLLLLNCPEMTLCGGQDVKVQLLTFFLMTPSSLALCFLFFVFSVRPFLLHLVFLFLLLLLFLLVFRLNVFRPDVNDIVDWA